MVLANADDSLSIGEGYRFFKRFYEQDTLCGCHEKIEACEFWKFVDHYIQERHPNYQPSSIWNRIENLLLHKNYNKIPRLLQQESNKDLVGIISDFYKAIFKKSNTKLIIDGSKNVGWLRILYELNLYEIHIIHLERNLEQVANSWKKKVLLPEYYDKEVYMPIRSNYTMVKTWFKIKQNIKFFVGLNYHYISYERFVDHPVSYKRVFQKLVLSTIDFDSLTVKPNHAIGGNPMRFQVQDTFEIALPSNKLNHLNRLERFLFQILRKLPL